MLCTDTDMEALASVDMDMVEVVVSVLAEVSL